MTVYRFSGTSPHELPSLPLGHALEPGEEFDGPDGLVNAQVERQTADGWEPTQPVPVVEPEAPVEPPAKPHRARKAAG